MKHFLPRLGIFYCLFGLFACQQHRELVPNGLKFIQVGDKMIPPDQAKIKGKYLRDTLFQEEDYKWRAAVLDYPTGKVYIEEDFYGQNSVSRIRVEAEQLMFRKQIYPGMNLGDLKKLPWKWEVSYLESYQVWDLNSTAFPKLHLLVPVDSSPTIEPEIVNSLDQLSNQAIIKSLVFL